MGMNRLRKIVISSILASLTVTQGAYGQSCVGSNLTSVRGLNGAKVLSDGTLMGRAKVNINIDGYGRAYHPTNASAGALIHLCNAGEVFLPNGTRYHGSRDNPTCVGRFMADFARIQAAGWKDPRVGAIRWYGILGSGEVRIANLKVAGVIPSYQSDGSGFFVSPTTFADSAVADQTTQTRYIHPLRIPAAVIPNQPELKNRGVVIGSFGVAYDPTRGIAVPFVVGDFGPRVGEATPALARSLAGLPITDMVTRKNRFAGQVDESRVVWAFFGSGFGTTRYDSRNEQALNIAAKEAFERWGGAARIQGCAAQ